MDPKTFSSRRMSWPRHLRELELEPSGDLWDNKMWTYHTLTSISELQNYQDWPSLHVPHNDALPQFWPWYQLDYWPNPFWKFAQRSLERDARATPSRCLPFDGPRQPFGDLGWRNRDCVETWHGPSKHTHSKSPTWTVLLGLQRLQCRRWRLQKHLRHATNLKWQANSNGTKTSKLRYICIIIRTQNKQFLN